MLTPTERTSIVTLSKAFIGAIALQAVEQDCLGICTKEKSQQIAEAEMVIFGIEQDKSSLLTDLQLDTLHYALVDILKIRYNS